MREFPVIDSAVSVDQLRMRLKDNELEQYGDAFIPEYVYDVIRRLPRFSSMRVGRLVHHFDPRLSDITIARTSARCRRISPTP